MTLQDYFTTPKTVLPQELIFGATRVADAPFVAHQRIVLRFAVALEAHAARRRAGEVLIAPVDVILDAEAPLVLQPDLLFVARERSSIVLDRVYGAPDLVLEVLSPNPRIGALEERVRWFARYGVREIWLYEQLTKRLDVLTCRNGVVLASTPFDRHTPIASAVLPEFASSTSDVLQAR